MAHDEDGAEGGEQGEQGECRGLRPGRTLDLRGLEVLVGDEQRRPGLGELPGQALGLMGERRPRGGRLQAHEGAVVAVVTDLLAFVEGVQLVEEAGGGEQRGLRR